MGASSRSPSPITIVPCIGTVSIVLRMDSVATWSLSGRSPWPMVRADSMAAFSTTRKNSSARSLSIFSPKFFACGSGRPSVGIDTSYLKCDLGIYPLRSRDGSAGENGMSVWSRATSPATVYSKIACRVSTDFVCDLTRMQRPLHIGCHHAVHLDVKELSPFQDMAALPTFVPHADFSQDSCRRKVVSEMA